MLEDAAAASTAGPGIFVEVPNVSHNFCLQGGQVDVADQIRKNRGLRSEVRGQGYRMNDSGFLSIEPSILPTDRHFSVRRS